MFTLDDRRDDVQLAFRDAGVRRVVVTDRVAFELADRDRDVLRVEVAAPFEARHRGGETWALDPARTDDERLGRLAFALRHAWLVHCDAGADGTLALMLEGGLRLVVPAAPATPAWELANPRFAVAARAGGGLAIRRHDA